MVAIVQANPHDLGRFGRRKEPDPLQRMRSVCHGKCAEDVALDLPNNRVLDHTVPWLLAGDESHNPHNSSLQLSVISVWLTSSRTFPYDRSFNPSTSCISYRPGDRPMTQRAARKAPRAKLSRLWARCVTSIRSPILPKITVCSPTTSPALNAWMAISSLPRSPTNPLRP